ncbi:MAG: aminotransferase class V-fold PLP-dependent enzyme [Mycobacteriales bacterium]
MDSSALAHAWDLEPDTAHLNHGSFGAAPKIVLDRQAELRRELEANPTRFLLHRLPDLLDQARLEIGAFLGAAPAQTAFLANATEATQTVIANLKLRPGDEVVTTDHCYVAVLAQLRRATQEAGASLRIVSLPLPLAEREEVSGPILDELGPRTKMLVVDHVASPTGLVFPIDQIVAGAHRAGVQVLVDGAHAAGMLPVDLAALEADFWVGNLHKWVCAPKSCAVLVAHSDRQLQPLVTSQRFDEGYPAAFDWTGTRDPSPLLCAPTAIGFFAQLGWERVRANNNALASAGAEAVATILDTEAPIASSLAAAMRLIELPRPLSELSARALELELLERHRVVVPVTNHGGWRWIRVSAQLYNCLADYERLAEVLPRALRAVGEGLD